MTIVYSLLQLNYVDNKLINSLEKVIKHRGCQVYNIFPRIFLFNLFVFFKIVNVKNVPGQKF